MREVVRTYSASGIVGTAFADENTVFILAASAKIITLNPDIEIQLGVGGRAVLENREPLAVVLADTKVKRGPVANRLATITPLAGSLGRDTLVVDIVLGRGDLALPFEVGLAVRAGQWVNVSILNVERDGLGFGTYARFN